MRDPSRAVLCGRCFFIHLGIALGVHPFALQTAFRRMATAALDHAGTMKCHVDAVAWLRRDYCLIMHAVFAFPLL
jgi:hypothetical protein